MNGTCDCCDHDPLATRASLRRTMAECEDCGRTLCEECLMEMAVEKGLAGANEAEAIRDGSGAEGFLVRCRESHMNLCPECFEDGGEDDL